MHHPRYAGKRARRCSLALALPLALVAGSALGQTSPALDRVSIWAGGYYPQMDTTISANDKSGRINGDVNLEDDLGFRDHKTVPRLRADFLIGDHQGFSFDYYSVNRTRTKSLARDITYDGNAYHAAARVDGKLNFDFGSASYRWWFGEGNDVFGLGLGAGYYRVEAAISGEASLNDESVQASSRSRESAWAPLLQLGWRHAFNDNWRMYFDAAGVRKNGGKLNGHIYKAALGVEWFPWKNVGFGAEYGYAQIKLNQRKHDYDAHLDMKLNGPSLFARFRF